MSIKKSTGVTETEKYLSELADQSFLDLWSYTNVFKESGKELCDLLVVCGNHVILFSDKENSWSSEKTLPVAWKRWVNASVMKGADQLHGAERWIKRTPNELYFDAKCTERFPAILPPVENMQIHCVVVAHGASEACSEYFGEKNSTFAIVPNMIGEDHLAPTGEEHFYFSFGDIYPQKTFVHVFDKFALDVLMFELDTITDFTEYLTHRADFIRLKKLSFSPSEHDLLSLYILSTNEDGKHLFLRPDGEELTNGDSIIISPGHYSELQSYPLYQNKKTADDVSYAWDNIIKLFTEHVIKGTSVPIMNSPASVELSEKALRIMALESRLSRRTLAQAFLDALNKAEELRAPRFARMIVPTIPGRDNQIAYLILIMAYPEKEPEGGYEQYRKVRVAMLNAYCLSTGYEHRHIRQIIGIAVDASSRITGRVGGSEDLIAIEFDDWNQELEKEVMRVRKLFDIHDPSRMQISNLSADEFPKTPLNPTPLTRQQRRAKERRMRKNG